MALSKVEVSISSNDISKYVNAIEYNDYLIKNNINLTLIEYIKDANKKFYEYDISFMEDFMELVNRDDFCISHEYLKKYKIITINCDNSNISKMLKSRGLDEGKDFNPLQEEVVRKNGSIVKKTVYYLTPDAFKKCLIGSTKTDKYANYFLLLEKMIKFYNQYQLKLKDNKLIIKENQINELIIEMRKQNKELKLSNNKLDKLSIKNDKLSIKNDELLIENKNQTIKINKLCNIVEDTNIKTEEIAEHLHIVSHNQVPELNDDKMTHVYILLKKNDKKNEYYSLRTQQSKVKSVLNKKTDYNVILRFDNCPNPIELGTLIKEELKDIVTYRNNIFRRRINITEIELINKINELYDRRIITVL